MNVLHFLCSIINNKITMILFCLFTFMIYIGLFDRITSKKINYGSIKHDKYQVNIFINFHIFSSLYKDHRK